VNAIWADDQTKYRILESGGMTDSAKVAIVTGANGGLGTAMCKALCDQGRRVAGAYYTAEQEEAVAWQAAMREAGYDVPIYPVDVSDYDQCVALVEAVERDLGPVEILVNNAGITRDGVIKKMRKDQWDSVLRTNLDSMFNMTRQVFEKMCDRGWGRIVNISSLNGRKGQFGQANYSAAKSGVHGFTMAAAQEGARRGVTVNTISPGYIGTEMVMAIAEEVRDKIVAQIPVGRLGTPEEVARTMTFLTDDEAGFITGAEFSVNGGQHMH
jgi:acetoacetyl-CoA reductase